MNKMSKQVAECKAKMEAKAQYPCDLDPVDEVPKWLGIIQMVVLFCAGAVCIVVLFGYIYMNGGVMVIRQGDTKVPIRLWGGSDQESPPKWSKRGEPQPWYDRILRGEK